MIIYSPIQSLYIQYVFFESSVCSIRIAQSMQGKYFMFRFFVSSRSVHVLQLVEIQWIEGLNSQEAVTSSGVRWQYVDEIPIFPKQTTRGCPKMFQNHQNCNSSIPVENMKTNLGFWACIPFWDGLSTPFQFYSGCGLLCRRWSAAFRRTTWWPS